MKKRRLPILLICITLCLWMAVLPAAAAGSPGQRAASPSWLGLYVWNDDYGGRLYLAVTSQTSETISGELSFSYASGGYGKRSFTFELTSPDVATEPFQNGGLLYYRLQDNKIVVDYPNGWWADREYVKQPSAFLDVAEGAYYFDAVNWAVAHRITSGMDAVSFRPEAACTRAQAVTFLWRAAGEPKPASSADPFVDVRAGQYYYDAVLWAVEQGITNGTNASHFSPDATCTRAQILTFLWRAGGQPEPKRLDSPFRDVANPDDYYFKAVLWAVERGITNGMDAQHFRPDATCNRGQIVTFLYRSAMN